MPSDPTTSRLSVRDWLSVAAVALMWGSSFLFIKIGVQDFPPGTVAWLRISLGAAALACLPIARTPLRHPGDRRLIAVLGIVWMAIPFTLFAYAEVHISSALAGMINGATPLFTALLAALWLRDRTSRRMAVGLVVGFLGVVVTGWPNVEGRASAAAVVMVLAATLCYGVAFNISGVLQRRNGALPVIWRAQIVAMIVTTPLGVTGLVEATPSLAGVTAILVLGVLGSGAAFVMFTDLAGRVGATRGSITTYLAPVIALALGAGLAGEAIARLSLLGIVLVLVGAWLTSAGRGPTPSDGAGRR